jgi:hypothetical protein
VGFPSLPVPLLLVAALALTGCKSDDTEFPPPVMGQEDGGAARPIVPVPDGLGLPDSPPGDETDAEAPEGVRRDAAARLDVAAPDTRPADARLAGDDARACDLLRQDCPNRAQSCVPVAGRAICELPTGARPEGADCVDVLQCDRGLVCFQAGVDRGICRRVCDPAAPPRDCPRCVPLSGFAAGTCAP